MRPIVLFVLAIAVVGCGTSSASPKPKPTPAPTQAQKWSQAPAMTINRNHKYTAKLVTSDGTLTVTLLPKVAPIAVNNFVFLARHHFYDGVIFHRILKNFVAQTGDPTGTGLGGPGYTFKDERVTMPYTFRTVAMANSGPNTNGSQFFIVLGPRIKLNPAFTIFGKVTAGLATLRNLNNEQVTYNPGTNEFSEPVNPPVLKKVTIHEST